MLPVFLALVAAILLLAGVAWALSGGLTGSGDGVKVPSVEGQPLEEARGNLEDAGFKVGVTREESPANKEGVVLDQSVNGGETAKKGSEIGLTVGEGPSTVAVPNIPYEATPDEARKQLEESGLKLGNQSEAPSEEYVAGGIISQDPLPNVEVERGTAVDITLSTGPAAAPAPEITAPSESAQPENPAPSESSQPEAPAPAAPTEEPAQPEPSVQEPAPAEKAPKPAKEPKPAAGGEIQKEARQESKDAVEEVQEEAE